MTPVLQMEKPRPQGGMDPALPHSRGQGPGCCPCVLAQRCPLCLGDVEVAPVHGKGDSLIGFRFIPCFDSEMLYRDHS